MRYLTKKWATLGRKTRDYINLQVDENATRYSEKYYKKLYMIEYEYMNRTEEWNFDDLDRSLELRMKIIENRFPKKVLEEVADIRVIALGMATKEIIDKMNIFCDNNSKVYDQILLQYNDYFQKINSHSIFDFVNQIDFKDRGINEIEINGGKLFLKFVNLRNEFKYSVIEFEDFEIINKDCDLIGLIWDSIEVYFEEELYELHVLLWDLGEIDISYHELTIRAKKINIG